MHTHTHAFFLSFCLSSDLVPINSHVQRVSELIRINCQELVAFLFCLCLPNNVPFCFLRLICTIFSPCGEIVMFLGFIQVTRLQERRCFSFTAIHTFTSLIVCNELLFNILLAAGLLRFILLTILSLYK
jgi:hypothetical protein